MTRNTSNIPNEVDRAQPTEAAAYTRTPVSMTGLRPRASDSGPWKMLMIANEAR